MCLLSTHSVISTIETWYIHVTRKMESTVMVMMAARNDHIYYNVCAPNKRIYNHNNNEMVIYLIGCCESLSASWIGLAGHNMSERNKIVSFFSLFTHHTIMTRCGTGNHNTFIKRVKIIIIKYKTGKSSGEGGETKNCSTHSVAQVNTRCATIVWSQNA